MQSSTWANWPVVSLLLAVVLIAAGCADSPSPPIVNAQEEEGPKEQVPWTSESLVLQAMKTYAPVSWKDGETTPPSPVQFKIPTEIPVLLGNGGNQTVELRFRTPESAEIACTYRGGSEVSHPGDAYEKARGHRYHFETCDNGLHADQAATGVWFRLHINDGDSQDPAALTQVEIQLGASLSELSPPISEEESVKIREAFSWKATKELPEETTEGSPTLYYTLVYVEEREQIDALDELLVHYSTLPLFADELARWEGQSGMFTHDGDGHGLFLFALMPGVTYNLLRFHALAGDDLFSVIALRDTPPSARSLDGSISYEALRTSGFVYRDLTPDDVETWPASPEQPQPKMLFNAWKRALLKKLAKLVISTVRLVVKGIGLVDRWIGGSVELSVRLDMRNLDPRFGVDTPMQRAWGKGAGQQVNLPGVRVSVWQTSLGVIPTLFSARTDDTSVARMKVALGKKATICVSAESPAALITSLLVAREVCQFGSVNGSQLHHDLNLPIPVKHRLFNVLAQASEGRAYLKDVAGYTPYKADILVGKLANFAMASQDGVAVTPCFGFPNLAYDTLVDYLANAVSLVPVVGSAMRLVIKSAGILYAVDMILPDSPSVADPSIDDNFDSRGIVSHEYGHFALCSLLYSERPGNITDGYTDAILSRIKEGGAPSASAEAGYINEAFADFFAAQVVGGVNYFAPGGGTNTEEDCDPGFSSLGMCYCLADSKGTCMEANATSTGSFDDHVARVATLLHDAFDGAPSLPAQNLPGNADAWNDSTGVLNYSMTSHTGSNADEGVALNGKHLQTLIAKWNDRGDKLTEDNFLGGLSDAMADAGYDWCSRCEVFALHDSRWNTYAMHYADLCTLAPIASWIGPSAQSSVITLQPGPEGKDAFVSSRPDLLDTNEGDYRSLFAMAWTWNGVPGITRSFLEFDLSSLPPETQVLSAKLTLHPDLISTIPPGHSDQSGSNDGFLWRVAAPWDEATITWNNQPPGDNSVGVIFPRSTSNDEIYVVDVTAMVAAMVKFPASNHGVMIQLATEQHYRALEFMSSDAIDATLRPRLDVTVATGCQ